MTNQQLYLDNQLMDLSEDTEITLDIKSNIFRDVTKMTSNNTYTIQLPKTVHNMTVLELSDKPRSGSSYPFRFHTARYYRNGLEIFNNGRASVLSIGDNIEISIYWGMFPALADMQSSELKLNELDAYIYMRFNRQNAAEKYDDVIDQGFFYAAYDTAAYKSASEDWVNYDTTQATDLPISTQATTNDSGYSGYGEGGRNSYSGGIQPTVTCAYLLNEIALTTDIGFIWDDKAQRIIDTLAIPVVTRKADEKSAGGEILGSFVPTAELGKMTFSLLTANKVLFSEGEGEHQQLTVLASCQLTIDVRAIWSWDASKAQPQGYRTWQNDDGTETTVGLYSYAPHYIEMKVQPRDTEEQAKTYIIGQPDSSEDAPTASITDYSTDLVNGKFIHKITGHGTLDFSEGDIITFELKHPKGKKLRGLNCYNGYISAVAKQGDEVPYGGYFPVIKNLPDITIISFIKFLCVITGTFPLQDTSGGNLRLISISNVLDKSTISERAVDWTNKLIPSMGANRPRQIDFSVDDYCQHNIYKWKDDDTVRNNYDADMSVENKTLELTQDTYTMPFAASDGNRVPIYDWESYTAHYGSGDNKKTVSQQSATKYKACKDRIMNVYKREDGCAALRFDIDLQGLFDNDLKDFRRMLANPRQITERFNLSDIDILNFDETKPVYLAQYGCYFLVLEIKTTNSGYCEVQLIEIN